MVMSHQASLHQSMIPIPAVSTIVLAFCIIACCSPAFHNIVIHWENRAALEESPISATGLDPP